MREIIENRKITLLKYDPLRREGFNVLQFIPRVEFEKAFEVARQYISLFEERFGDLADLYWDVHLLFGLLNGLPIAEIGILAIDMRTGAKEHSGFWNAEELLNVEQNFGHRYLLLDKIKPKGRA